jgi:hypothetical protein
VAAATGGRRDVGAGRGKERNGGRNATAQGEIGAPRKHAGASTGAQGMALVC